MNKKDKYIFPAVFHYDKDGISIDFPDLPGCLSCSSSTEEAFKDAKEALGLHLWSMENDQDKIPEPSELKKIEITDNSEVIVLIDVFMPPVRDRINNSFIKKTLSIPKWLNTIAEENNVNFSQVLQKALKEYLNLKV